MLGYLLRELGTVLLYYPVVVVSFFLPGWLIARNLPRLPRVLFRVVLATLTLAPSFFVCPGGEDCGIAPALMVVTYYWEEADTLNGMVLLSLLATGVVAISVTLAIEARGPKADRSPGKVGQVEYVSRLILAILACSWFWLPRNEYGRTPGWIFLWGDVYTGLVDAPAAGLFLLLLPFLILCNAALAVRSSARPGRWFALISRIPLLILLPVSLYLAFGTDLSYRKLYFYDNGTRVWAGTAVIVLSVLLEVALMVKKRFVGQQEVAKEAAVGNHE